MNDFIQLLPTTPNIKKEPQTQQPHTQSTKLQITAEKLNSLFTSRTILFSDVPQDLPPQVEISTLEVDKQLFSSVCFDNKADYQKFSAFGRKISSFNKKQQFFLVLGEETAVNPPSLVFPEKNDVFGQKILQNMPGQLQKQYKQVMQSQMQKFRNSCRLEAQMAASDEITQQMYNLELEDPVNIGFDLNNEIKNCLCNYEAKIQSIVVENANKLQLGSKEKSNSVKQMMERKKLLLQQLK